MNTERAIRILTALFPHATLREVPGNPNIIGGFLFVVGLQTHMVMPSGVVINCHTGEAVLRTSGGALIPLDQNQQTIQ